MTKICIAVPTYGTITARTALSIIQTINQNKQIDFFPVFQHGSYIPENRDNLVTMAQNNLCSHIFFVDHDMAFNHYTLPMLLGAEKDIVGVMYNYRRLPLETITKFIGKNGETTTKIDQMPGTLFKVAGIGCGCLLIKMSVFNKLTRPYFPMSFDDKGQVTVSEDIGFCEKAKDAGFDIWCDPTVEVKHYGDFAY